MRPVWLTSWHHHKGEHQAGRSHSRDTHQHSLLFACFRRFSPNIAQRSDMATVVLGPVWADADTMQPPKVSAFDLARLWKVLEIPAWKEINTVHLAAQDPSVPGSNLPQWPAGTYLHGDEKHSKLKVRMVSEQDASRSPMAVFGRCSRCKTSTFMKWLRNKSAWRDHTTLRNNEAFHCRLWPWPVYTIKESTGD